LLLVLVRQETLAYKQYRPPLGKQDTRDPRDAPTNRQGPPQSDTSGPGDMDELKAWGEAERARIVALKDPDAVIKAGDAMVTDKRWGRLKAYDQMDARRIHSSIRNRIEELKS